MKTINVLLLLLLVQLFDCAVIFSQNYPWEDIVINVSNPEVMKDTKFTKDEFGRIYFIGNNGIIYYLDKSNNLNWNCNWIYNGASDIKVRENSALLYTSNYLYYAGVNNEVCCYYYNSSTGWQNRVLNTSFSNVLPGTNFTIDENGRIYYVGIDRYVYYIVRNGSNFTCVRLNTGSGILVRSYSNIIYHENHIFYVGLNNEICNYWWNSSTSGFWNINTSFANVKARTEIVKDQYGRIFWVADSGILHCIHWSNNNWISYWWAPNYLVDENNGLCYHDDKFYYTNQDKIGCVFWDGNQLKHQILNDNSRVQDNSFFEISNNGDLIYYSSIDKKIHLLTPKIYWEEEIVLNSNWKEWVNSVGILKNNVVKKLYKPKDYQLYPRDNNNQGNVKFKGNVFGVNNITINIKKQSFNGNITDNNYVFPVSNYGFNFDVNINAELSEYDFKYKLANQSFTTKIADKVVCGDFYAISGQSNASSSDLSQNEINDYNNNYGPNSTYGKYSRTYNRGFYGGDKSWGIPSLSNSVWGFQTGIIGLYLQYQIQTTYQIPVCIINDAFGGTAVTEHTPISSTDPFYFETGIDGWKFKHIQGHLNTWLKEMGAENNLKGFIWWQGEHETSNNEAYGYYKNKFLEIHNSLNEVVSNNFITYLFQVHAFPSPESVGKRTVCEDQRTMSLFIPNAVIKPVSSNGLQHRTETDHEIHFTLDGYKNASKNVFYQMEQDYYGKPFSYTNLPLNVEQINLINSTVYVKFNQNISSANSDNINNILNAFTLSNNAIKSVPNINGNVFSFNVSSIEQLTNVSYLGVLPSYDWNFPCHLRNAKNIAALSFSEFPITNPDNLRSCESNDNNTIERIVAQQCIQGKNSTAIEDNEIFLYPNPATTIVNLKGPNNKISKVEFYTTAGKLINKFVLDKNQEIFQIDLSEHTPGLYVIKIYTDNNIFNKKLIID